MLKKIFFRLFKKFKIDKDWEIRIKDVLKSPDNLYIPRVINAGKVNNGVQVMHNGIKILAGSYYGKEITTMLRRNKGVHEPQEERIFKEVLDILPCNPIILELGAYWAFYSMWFLKETKNGKAYLIEPDFNNLEFGIKNFKLNNLLGTFELGMIGSDLNLENNPPFLTVDHVIEKRKISFLDVLHCDIQGYEYQMLMGAILTFTQKKIGYVFISTHSNSIHKQCIEFLEKMDYKIACECNLDETYSFDGLIVANLNGYPQIKQLTISKKVNF